jgi:hypothetical protein
MLAQSWLAACFLYLLLAGVFLWARTCTPLLPAPTQYVLTPVDSSANVRLQTAYFTGILLAPDPARDRVVDGCTPLVLTVEQVLAAEAVLAACVASGNTRGREPRIWPGALHPLGQYYRQYRGYRTPSGQVVVWVQGVAKTRVTRRSRLADWQRNEIGGADWGKDLFEVSIDLTTKECFHFMRSSNGA